MRAGVEPTTATGMNTMTPAQQQREITRQAREMAAAQKAAERERKAQEKAQRDAARAQQRSIDNAIRTGGRVATSRLGQDIIRGVFGDLVRGRQVPLTGRGGYSMTRSAGSVGLRRVPRLEARDGVGEDRRHGQVPEPLVVGGHDVPRGRCRRCLRQGVLERRLVVVPVLPLLEIAQRELPALRRILEARLEALPLLVAVDGQEELDDRRAVLRRACPRTR